MSNRFGPPPEYVEVFIKDQFSGNYNMHPEWRKFFIDITDFLNTLADAESYPAGTAAPAGGTGSAAGGYDTAAHRDTAITLINTMRSALIAKGILS